jgi:predicted NUDIX family NTP pyrophosphohydrolase
MPVKIAAGLLMYRVLSDGEVEVYLAHPGGPYFVKKDEGAWTIPKGEIEIGEDLLDAARREWQEEIGYAPEGPFIPLGEIKQKGGKIVHAWAFAGAPGEPPAAASNTFRMEWPPGSGRSAEFPEIDRAAYLPIAAARRKLKPAQAPFLDRLLAILAP